MKDRLKKILRRRYNISFSKSGDDVQLMKLINQSTPGAYVDIGCWHPIDASNTYYFSLRGWKGICIDPNPELIPLYKSMRRDDIFVNSAIGSNEGNLNYYMLNDKFSSMNTLNHDFLVQNNVENQIKKVIEIPVQSLKSILDKTLSPNDRLDFFDVDVEGYDLEVLKTNDWTKYRPKIVIVESDQSIFEDVNSEITQYLTSVNYKLIGKSNINSELGNLYFMDNKL